MFILLEDHIDIHQPKDQKKNYKYYEQVYEQ